MVIFPKTTEFNRRIPKQKFYENLSVTPQIRRAFVEQIQGIWWANKIAPSTLNIEAGETVTEIEVFTVKLSAPSLDETVLRLIDREIPYHIVFLLSYEDKVQAWTAYKEHSAGNAAFKVGAYYHTEWMAEEELPLRIEGLTTDAVYENFVRQIAGDALKNTAGETLKDAVEKAQAREKLQKEIDRLEKLARAEKQPKKKFEYSQKIKELQRRLDEEEFFYG